LKISDQVAQQRIPAGEFRSECHAPGQKHAFLLDLGIQACPGLALPVLLIQGAQNGKTLALTAGVHGDEFEGIRALFDLSDQIDPAELSGRVVAVPVANPPAFSSGSRTSPLDGGNLARAFPGSEIGSPTQVIAFHLGRSIIGRADFYVDLHTAGTKLLMPRMVGYDIHDSRSHEAAMAFGAPVLWGHGEIPPGRTISFASSRRIPWLYTESCGGRTVDLEEVEMFTRGLMNVMRYLQMLPGSFRPAGASRLIYGNGDLDSGIAATRSGFLIPSVELLQDVKAGQALGRTVDLLGMPVESFASPCDGTVAMIHAFPVVNAGESLFLVASSHAHEDRERSQQLGSCLNATGLESSQHLKIQGSRKAIP